MEELIRQALTILRGMWKYRWPAVLASWVVALVGVVVIFKIPDQYEASARIYVDTQSILKPLMAGLTVQPNVQQQVSMLSRTLISRPNVEKLIRMADMDLKTSSKLEQEALIDRLTKEIVIRNTGRDNLYNLAFKDSDQEKAKRVIQSLVSIFVESSLGATRKDTDSAKTFLNEQIKQYEARLEEAEGRLKDFRIRNIDQATADGKDATSRVGESFRQLEQARLELRESENARDSVKAQMAAAEKDKLVAAQAAASSPAAEAQLPISTPEIDARIDNQKRNLDALLQRYTEQHPDIIAARRLIRDLEEQKKKEVAELRKSGAGNAGAMGMAGMGMGAMGQDMTRMLAQAEAQVASLKARVGEYTSRYQAARESLKTAPQLEAEATQLNRDYSALKRGYDELVTRRQSAVLSGELDVASGVADFRLIDPPRVTPKPVSPNRLLLLPMALAAAAIAGVLVAFAGSQLRPVFMDANALRSKTGLPVLGVVSISLNEADRNQERRGTMKFYGTAVGLVGMFVIGMAAMAVVGRG